MPSAGFAPTKSKNEPEGASYGWALMAGFGVLAAGYGLWEWRYEIAKAGAGILARVRKL